MTKIKKSACEEQQRVQREKRRTPFDSTTKLIELVDKRHYGDIMQLVKRLKPYLKDGERGFTVLTKLDFDLERISLKRQFVIAELAFLLGKLQSENGLKYKQSVFIRYFASPDHCNLGISEKSLKALILEAKRCIF